MLPLLTPALEAFITLLEKIINLEKSKLQDKEDLFNQIVKPLFEDLEPVAINYMEIFRNARKIVSELYPKGMHEVVLRIRDDRETMSMARIKVAEMAHQVLENLEDKDILGFAVEIIIFFSIATDPLGNIPIDSLTGSKSFLLLLERIERNGATPDDKSVILRFIDTTLDLLEKRWKIIVSRYQKIKIHSITSPRLTRKNS